MKTINLFFVFLMISILSISLISNAQPVTEEWVARYNGPGNGGDKAYSLAVDALGNVYVTGVSIGSGTGSDMATIKYNSSGVQQWVARYNGPGNNLDEAYAIAVDALGNVYVTGVSIGSGTGSDMATIKYNSSGVQRWVARYNGPGNSLDEAHDIAVDSAGNVYVTGWSYGSPSKDYATIKYDSIGVEQWVARYNGSGNWTDEATAIAVDSAGNVYVTGWSVGSSSGDDYATIKYDPSGVEQWVARYYGPVVNDFDHATAITVDGAGNVYVTGWSYGGNVTNRDYATIKYNSSGVELWVARYNGPGNSYDYPYTIAIDGGGNVYVTGWSIGSGTDGDYATIKYNSNGVEMWVARYNGTGDVYDEAYDLAVDNAGNVYVTGRSGDLSTNFDYATIKYNSSGVELWVARYNGPGNWTDKANAIVVDDLGNVYVTGESQGLNEDFATIKYSQTTGIQNTSSEIPKQFSLYQNFPNPFNPTTKIRFDIAKFSDVNISVYDVLGRNVTTLVNEKLSAGSYEINWNATQFSSGIYFYRMNTSEFTETRSMVMLK